MKRKMRMRMRKNWKRRRTFQSNHYLSFQRRGSGAYRT